MSETEVGKIHVMRGLKRPTPAEVEKAMNEKLEADIKAAEEEARLYTEKRFDELVAEKRIQVSENEDGSPLYLIARSCLNKHDAVMLGDRVDMLHLFDSIKSVCFLNGMVDGVEKYQGQIALLRPHAKNRESQFILLKSSQAGDGMLEALRTAVAEANEKITPSTPA